MAEKGKNNGDYRFKRSIYTTQCLDIIRNAKAGIIPYGVFSDEIGLDMQAVPGRSFLLSARRIALNQYGIVTRAVSNKGIEIFNESRIASKISQETTDAIRRRAEKAAKELNTVQNYDDLTNEEKISLNRSRSVVGVVGLMHMTDSMKKFTNAVVERKKMLGIKDVLKLFAPEEKPDESA